MERGRSDSPGMAGVSKQLVVGTWAAEWDVQPSTVGGGGRRRRRMTTTEMQRTLAPLAIATPTARAELKEGEIFTL